MSKTDLGTQACGQVFDPGNDSVEALDMLKDAWTAGMDGRQRISLEGAHEVREWATRFGVTEGALRRAVERVGDRASDVQRELGGRR
ncbi:DUF3606 domain-containing protein [Brevundimonas sp. GCM10030266]|uniref:DUF3606 domain-containing protein n=1 Tax=Brevundimonas sp. GCM10030266 TaxID=3273386 RepID=UPI0036195858